MFSRTLGLLGWNRDAFRLDNCVRCAPPKGWFDERAPWYYGALAHCQYVERETLAQGSKVVVALGGTALKRLMHLEHHKDSIKIGDWHGAILRDPTDRYFVVPTYHPSFLQRGATNLIGTVLWDLKQAEIARDTGKPADAGSLVIDPPLDWFRTWVDTVVAARQQDSAAYPISSDVETPDKAGGKDEGEITAEHKSFQILRVNVACHPDEGVTVPFAEGYIQELARLHQSPGQIFEFNREYDFVRQVHAGMLCEEDSAKVIDLMWLWHLLQSDVPRGLGFVAPFYSTSGPWKHLARSEPARYAAIDALQTHRVGFGLLTDLQATGQLAIAMRHTHRLLTEVLRPAQLVGVKVDRIRLDVFKQTLTEKARASLQALQLCVPESVCPLTPKEGLVHKPLENVLHVKATAFTRKGTARAGRQPAEIKQELYATARLVEKLVLKEVWVCHACRGVDVSRRHTCQPQLPVGLGGRLDSPVPADLPSQTERPTLSLAPASVPRWFWQEPFNPDSWPQVLAYIKAKKHTPGRAEKTGKDSTNRDTLIRLERTTHDPFYRHLLDYRAVGKVKGTYVEGTERLLDTDDRLHPTFTFKPSTMRLSAAAPNLTNVIQDREGPTSLAAGFRKTIVASPGCRLLECDFSSIEATEVAWCVRDPTLLRVARLGIHAYLVAHHLNDAPDLSAADADIARHLQQVKKAAGPLLYDQMKHTVYGVFYGQTPAGLQYTWPDLYPTRKVAEAMVDFLFGHFPSVKTFQQVVLETAARQHFLGGSGAYQFTPPAPGIAGSVSGHPYAYCHWFWSLFSYKRLTRAEELRVLARAQQAGQAAPVTYIGGQAFRLSRGADANRAIAYYPQSIAAGVLKEVELRLFGDRESASYIGDAYFGRTPLRAPIHDSLLLDVPHREWDRVVQAVLVEMQCPIAAQPLPEAWGLGTHLTIGIVAKAGSNWAEMTDITEAARTETTVRPMEAEDEAELDDLGRAV